MKKWHEWAVKKRKIHYGERFAIYSEKGKGNNRRRAVGRYRFIERTAEIDKWISENMEV